MSVTFLREVRPKARKAHYCSLCTGRIEPGQTYTRTTNAYDGRVYDWLKCDPCAADEITTTVHEWTYHPDDGISAEDAYEWATENSTRPDAQRYLERARREDNTDD